MQTDRFPLLGCRKAIKRVIITVQMFCAFIIGTEWFNNLTIIVILVNSLMMMFDNPTEEPGPFMLVMEDIFTYFYTVEMFLKIIGMGLFFNTGAYLRDPGNMLDCFVVIMSYPEKFTP